MQSQIPAGITRFFLRQVGRQRQYSGTGSGTRDRREAKIEALKSGLNHYSVVEWHATADVTGKNPLVKSEAVKRHS